MVVGSSPSPRQGEPGNATAKEAKFGLEVALRGARNTSDITTMTSSCRMVDNGRLLPGADTGELEGGRIQDVARVRLYGQAQVRLGDGPLVVSAPFVAALAGSILAAELQKAGGAAAAFQLDRRVDVDCSGFPTGFSSRPPSDRSGRCLCHDHFRLEAYWDRWGS